MLGGRMCSSVVTQIFLSLPLIFFFLLLGFCYLRVAGVWAVTLMDFYIHMQDNSWSWKLCVWNDVTFVPLQWLDLDHHGNTKISHLWIAKRKMCSRDWLCLTDIVVYIQYCGVNIYFKFTYTVQLFYYFKHKNLSAAGVCESTQCKKNGFGKE